MKVLMAWVGQTDLNCAEDDETAEVGPIAQAVQGMDFDKIILFYNYSKADLSHFIPWLADRTPLTISHFKADLSSPTNYAQIYAFVKRNIETFLTEHPDASLTFHLSPGTPAMTAVWLLLAKTIFPATLIEASRESGVRVAEIPFNIHLDFLP